MPIDTPPRPASPTSAERRARAGRLVAVVLMTSVVAGCAGAEPPPPPAAVGGLSEATTFPDLSREHELRDVAYPQTPPVGGDHWPPQTADGYGWQQCGVYSEPVVDEFAVHSLEHGAVWLSYQPDAATGDVQALAALTAINTDYVLVSPVPGQPQPFMATAWGLQLGADRPDDPRLRTFTSTYAAGGQGGEKGADCAGGSGLAQARAALARVATAGPVVGPTGPGLTGPAPTVTRAPVPRPTLLTPP